MSKYKNKVMEIFKINIFLYINLIFLENCDIIKEKRSVIIMSFNAYTIAHITKQYNNNNISKWQELQHHIECAAYQGYNFYILNPREWQYMDKLVEYGFEIAETPDDYIVRWDRV